MGLAGRFQVNHQGEDSFGGAVAHPSISPIAISSIDMAFMKTPPFCAATLRLYLYLRCAAVPPNQQITKSVCLSRKNNNQQPNGSHCSCNKFRVNRFRSDLRPVACIGNPSHLAGPALPPPARFYASVIGFICPFPNGPHHVQTPRFERDQFGRNRSLINRPVHIHLLIQQLRCILI
jgi:hypothetical protein